MVLKRAARNIREKQEAGLDVAEPEEGVLTDVIGCRQTEGRTHFSNDRIVST